MSTRAAMATRWASLMGLLPLGGAKPQQHDQRQDPGRNVEMQEGHEDLSSVFVDKRTAMLRNTIVMRRPTVSVGHGMPWTAPGTNTPTTSEAKIIFAPSRKNPPIASDALFITPLTLPRGRRRCQVSRPIGQMRGFLFVVSLVTWALPSVRHLLCGNKCLTLNELGDVQSDIVASWVCQGSVERRRATEGNGGGSNSRRAGVRRADPATSQQCGRRDPANGGGGRGCGGAGERELRSGGGR